MISIPLASLGYDVTGIDTDAKSIAYANTINPHQNARFSTAEASNLEGRYDCVILAEVLEHLEQPLALVRKSHNLLCEGGLLLISVPNGYGWFEFEKFLCDRLKIDQIMWRLGLRWLINVVKWKLTRWEESPRLSSLSSSPHVQRFTYHKIKKMLTSSGLNIFAADGSALFSGSISALCFNGYKTILKINNRLGSILRPVASGYYFACRKI